MPRYDMRFRVNVSSHDEANLLFSAAAAGIPEPSLVGCTLIALHPAHPEVEEEYPPTVIPIKDRGKL